MKRVHLVWLWHMGISRSTATPKLGRYVLPWSATFMPLKDLLCGMVDIPCEFPTVHHLQCRASARQCTRGVRQL